MEKKHGILKIKGIKMKSIKRDKACKKISKLKLRVEYAKNLSYLLQRDVISCLDDLLWKAKTLTSKEEVELYYRDPNVNDPHQKPWKMYQHTKTKKFITESEFYYLGASFRVSNKTGQILLGDWWQLSKYQRRNSKSVRNVAGEEKQKEYKLVSNREKYLNSVNHLKDVADYLKKLNVKTSVKYQKKISKNPDKVIRPVLCIKPILVEA